LKSAKMVDNIQYFESCSLLSLKVVSAEEDEPEVIYSPISSSLLIQSLKDYRQLPHFIEHLIKCDVEYSVIFDYITSLPNYTEERKGGSYMDKALLIIGMKLNGITAEIYNQEFTNKYNEILNKRDFIIDILTYI